MVLCWCTYQCCQINECTLLLFTVLDISLTQMTYSAEESNAHVVVEICKTGRISDGYLTDVVVYLSSLTVENFGESSSFIPPDDPYSPNRASQL